MLLHQQKNHHDYNVEQLYAIEGKEQHKDTSRPVITITYINNEEQSVSKSFQ